MSIKCWPEGERPREKLLSLGPGALSDAELLAIFLRTGLPGISAVDLARQLIDRHGSLGRILQLPRPAFCTNPGLGQAKYAQLSAVLEMSRRYLQQELTEAPVFTQPDRVKNYLQSQLQHRERECFAALFLDNQHRLLAFEPIFEGTIDSAPVHPREVVKMALSHNAAALIISHNHPSGVAEPSQSDRLITDRLKQSLELVDIRLLDHIVVGCGCAVSFAERGWL
ncbi:MAG: DNA repair protein RadC [Natronospirillum sp.]|uniref:RadC family protein n=1 Tax=Natronospirillum sp. TaxID=2812955 RepID=UPI0025CB78F2|nr:DNA repair protein RadC [Natronospirillum sp.]MCH8551688.1 DNA repair protein RadC [Natronospirillum sp.]